MKIYCPKCHTCYSIEVGLIPADGKKLRCANCGEVWLCSHVDMETANSSILEDAPQNVIAGSDGQIISTPDTADKKQEDTVTNEEMTAIFSRLKDENEKITVESEKLSLPQKIFPKIKKLLGWHNRITITIEILVVLLIIGLSIFGLRYEIVRKFPQTEKLFSQISVPAKVVGEGLNFQNITRNYATQDNHEVLNIKGFIVNETENTLEIPKILINIMDADTNTLAEEKKEIDIKEIEPANKVSFNVFIDVPPEQAKYIVLTFTQ